MAKFQSIIKLNATNSYLLLSISHFTVKLAFQLSVNLPVHLLYRWLTGHYIICLSHPRFSLRPAGMISYIFNRAYQFNSFGISLFITMYFNSWLIACSTVSVAPPSRSACDASNANSLSNALLVL